MLVVVEIQGEKEVIYKCVKCGCFAKYNAGDVWVCGKHLTKVIDELLLYVLCFACGFLFGVGFF